MAYDLSRAGADSSVLGRAKDGAFVSFTLSVLASPRHKADPAVEKPSLRPPPSDGAAPPSRPFFIRIYQPDRPQPLSQPDTG